MTKKKIRNLFFDTKVINKRGSYPQFFNYFAPLFCPIKKNCDLCTVELFNILFHY
jgi:hypothetical protein